MATIHSLAGPRTLNQGVSLDLSSYWCRQEVALYLHNLALRSACSYYELRKDQVTSDGIFGIPG